MSHPHTTTPQNHTTTHHMSSSNLDFKSYLFKELCLKGLRTKHVNYNWDKLLKVSWFSWRHHSETGNGEVTTEVSVHQVDRMRKGILGSGGRIANKRNTLMHQGTINRQFGWKLWGEKLAKHISKKGLRSLKCCGHRLYDSKTCVCSLAYP